MHFFSVVAVVAIMTAQVLASSPVIHYTIERRGGPVATRGSANLTRLTRLLEETDRRYGLTQRQVKGNKLVRSVKPQGRSAGEDDDLMSRVGALDTWYVRFDQKPRRW